MRLYRIECPTRRCGPWTVTRKPREKSWGWQKINNHSPWTLPGPRDDGISVSLDRNHKLKCFVEDFAQLREWFPNPFLHEMEKDGFVLAEYEAPEEKIHIGGHQIVASIEHVHHIGDHKPTIARENTCEYQQQDYMKLNKEIQQTSSI